MFDASAANWFGINAVCAKMQGYERIRGTVLFEGYPALLQTQNISGICCI